jgi:hypothetical protein
MANIDKHMREIDRFRAMCEVTRTESENYAKRKALVLALDIDDWPFKPPTGISDAVDARVDQSRSAAQRVQMSFAMARPAAFRRNVDHLAAALGNLARELAAANRQVSHAAPRRNTTVST